MRHQTPPDAVPSSVLILLFPAADGIRTVFIKRPRYDGVHSGQISLPGGKAEPGDPDTGYTALRETEEEIGVPAGEITLIGKLSELYIPPSNFLVTPWIGYVTFTPVFKPDPSEVDGLLEALIRDLADDRNVKEVLISVHGMELKAPAFVMHGEVIWGATAMILSEFREVIGKRNR